MAPRDARRRMIRGNLVVPVVVGFLVTTVVFNQTPTLAGQGGRAVSPIPSTSSVAVPKARASLDPSFRTYPVDIPDLSSPSGSSAPSKSAIPGYRLSNVTTFSGTSLPSGWQAFSGVPGSDPGAQWSVNHAEVAGGLLQLNMFQDPVYAKSWVGGGVCQCGNPMLYGAFFVRSRLTGPGPTQVELLWPLSGWPPEIDFNETYGATNFSMATDHYLANNLQIQRTVNVDMTQWHTWGVVWTPTSLDYVLDGKVWGKVMGSAEIPSVPMSLHIQQQSWCQSGWACPTSPQSTLVDWVAEYSPLAHQTMAIGPFPKGTSKLTTEMQLQVASLARQIRSEGNPIVNLVGYGDGTLAEPRSKNLGRSRVTAVALILRRQLASLGMNGIKISVTSVDAAVSSSQIAQTSPLPSYGKVVVSLN